MNDKLTAEQVRTTIFNCSTYASYDGAQYYASGINMQAIADELNAIGGGECGMVMVSNTKDARKCSACNKITCFDYPLDRNELNYCPKCGAKVRKAVKR